MKVGVIGAGMMGAGIAQVAAAAGHHVVLTDVDQARAGNGKAGIAKLLDRQVAKGQMEAEVAAATLARITPAGDTSGFADAAIVIEAATENEGLKQKIF